MYPPIYTTCLAVAAVKNIFSDPIRLYPFGEAPQGTVLPYATWSTYNGQPEHMLAEVPDTDKWNSQVDVFDKTAAGVRAAAKVLRDAIEPYADITFRGESKDPQTKDYRYTFDVDWQVIR